MLATLRTAFRTWTPWEEALTDIVLSKLGPKTQSILRTQLAAVNKVQRILGWRKIDLYVKRKGKVDRSGLPTLFDDREFVMSKTVTKVGEERFYTTISCVGGYLFSLESDVGVRRFAFRMKEEPNQALGCVFKLMEPFKQLEVRKKRYGSFPGSDKFKCAAVEAAKKIDLIAGDGSAPGCAWADPEEDVRPRRTS